MLKTGMKGFKNLVLELSCRLTYVIGFATVKHHECTKYISIQSVHYTTQHSYCKLQFILTNLKIKIYLRWSRTHKPAPLMHLCNLLLKNYFSESKKKFLKVITLT